MEELVSYIGTTVSQPGPDHAKSRRRVFTQVDAGMKKLWESYEEAMKQ